MSDVPSPEAWQQWLGQHAGRLLLFARQQARLSSEGEDLLQEALVEAWQRTGSGQLPSVPLVAATIRRRAIDWARSGDRRQRRAETVEWAADRPWFDPAAADAETREWLEVALRALPDDQRAVVTLKIWGELTFAEIAETLEIPANTAASRYRYGLERLRQELNDEHARPGP